MDVLDALKSQGREVLTIMITAYDFLAKPFTPDELRYALRKATSQLILSKQARKLAEEKRQVRFSFISVLAHELKAPLNAVEGYLNILRTTEEDQNLHDAPASGERPSGGGEAAPAAARAPARQPSGSPASFSGSGSAAASPSTPSTSRRRS